jgi:hypothetical protein
MGIRSVCSATAPCTLESLREFLKMLEQDGLLDEMSAD